LIRPTKKLHYWDSCFFLAFLKNEPDKIDERGNIPIIEWLDSLPGKAQNKCFIKLQRLAELGYELRRPEADFLRDKIYELRVNFKGINYRILYFFYKNKAVVISHGIIKEKEVLPLEIEQAIKNKAKFEKNPELHTYFQELI
jgi:phage-related protein